MYQWLHHEPLHFNRQLIQLKMCIFAYYINHQLYASFQATVMVTTVVHVTEVRDVPLGKARYCHQCGCQVGESYVVPNSHLSSWCETA